MIARCLTAQANLSIGKPCRLYYRSHHHFWRLVLLIKESANDVRITVDPKRELRQIVRADRESIEYCCEFFRQHYIAWNFRHDVYFKSVISSPQTLFCHDAND